MEALIDTGATISVISTDMIKQLGNIHRQYIDKSDVSMSTLANGTVDNRYYGWHNYLFYPRFILK